MSEIEDKLQKDEAKDIVYYEFTPLLILFISSLIWAVKTQNGIFDFYKVGYATEVQIANERGNVNNIPNHKYFVMIAGLMAAFMVLFYLIPIIIMIFYANVYSKTNQTIIKVLSYVGLAILLVSWISMAFISPLLAARSTIAFGAALGIIYITMTKLIDRSTKSGTDTESK
jgi:hypothetical protein